MREDIAFLSPPVVINMEPIDPLVENKSDQNWKPQLGSAGLFSWSVMEICIILKSHVDDCVLVSYWLNSDYWAKDIRKKIRNEHKTVCEF